MRFNLFVGIYYAPFESETNASGSLFSRIFANYEEKYLVILLVSKVKWKKPGSRKHSVWDIVKDWESQ